jgi:hypothetical protein
MRVAPHEPANFAVSRCWRRRVSGRPAPGVGGGDLVHDEHYAFCQGRGLCAHMPTSLGVVELIIVYRSVLI